MSSAAVVEAAARVVGRVLRSGAYSNVLVDQEADRSSDPARLRALVFDVLRNLSAFDAAISDAAGRAPGEVDPPVLDLLRVGAAELSGRRPAPVVVDTVVEATRSVAPRAAGFANAVMRRLAERGVDLDPEGEVPGWLREQVKAAWGGEEAGRFWRASLEPPQVGVRVRPGHHPPPGADPVPGIPSAFLWRGGRLEAGSVVQDPASVAVVQAADPRPGERVLEVGAAPGGKTRHLVDLVEPATSGGAVVALDAHPRRVRSARGRVPEARWVVGDGRVPPFARSSFDLVLVDAPCSGVGTLRRRPELLRRVTPGEVTRLAAVQTAILEAADGLVAPGGRLVYSVCTVTPEETVAVVAGRGFAPPGGLPGRVWGDGLLLAPHLSATDGMFIAVRG